MAESKELWIARDEGGALWLYGLEPERTKRRNLKRSYFELHWNCADTFKLDIVRKEARSCIEIDPALYPDVTWENSPQKLTIKPMQK